MIRCTRCGKDLEREDGGGRPASISGSILGDECNDCYSLVRIALGLQEATGAASINDLPIALDIAWYDEKVVGVVLALAALGLRKIRIGPTLPGGADARRRDAGDVGTHRRGAPTTQMSPPGRNPKGAWGLHGDH
jgi:hypothetical protein